MLDDLNRYFGLTVTKENRRVKCYVLKRIPGKPLAPGSHAESSQNQELQANGETQWQLKAYSMHEVIEILNGYIQVLLDPFAPILDETNLKGKIDLAFPSFDGSGLRGADIQRELNEALAPYGLTLVEEYKTRNMFVIKGR
jgi:uncharacterized protein (TIGR03435 family)